MDRDRLKAFLKELTALTDKYDIFIDGCGCCGSPSLWDNKGSWKGDFLQYNDDVNGYIIDNDTSIYD